MQLLFQKNKIEVTYCSSDKKYPALSPSPGQRQVSHSDVQCGMLGMLFAIIYDTVMPYLIQVLLFRGFLQHKIAFRLQSLRTSTACVKFLFLCYTLQQQVVHFVPEQLWDDQEGNYMVPFLDTKMCWSPKPSVWKVIPG